MNHIHHTLDAAQLIAATKVSYGVAGLYLGIVLTALRVVWRKTT